MEELLPHLQIGLADKKLDPKKLFSFAPKNIWLEIGFGGGEHLAAQAALHPAFGFIGCEPFVNGVASLLDHVDKQQIKNIRIFPDDARHILDALPEASVDRCFVLFADPWPKKKHANRRFIGSDTLPRLARVLKKKAELRLATDHMPLASWMRHCLDGSPEFEMLTDMSNPPKDWIETRYEQKARQAGRKPVYFSYLRR